MVFDVVNGDLVVGYDVLVDLCSPHRGWDRRECSWLNI